jgi:hypothetical protein
MKKSADRPVVVPIQIVDQIAKSFLGKKTLSRWMADECVKKSAFLSLLDVSQLPTFKGISDATLCVVERERLGREEVNQFTYDLKTHNSTPRLFVHVPSDFGFHAAVDSVEKLITDTADEIADLYNADIRWNLFSQSGVKIAAEIDYLGTKLRAFAENRLGCPIPLIESNTPLTTKVRQDLEAFTSEQLSLRNAYWVTDRSDYPALRFTFQERLGYAAVQPIITVCKSTRAGYVLNPAWTEAPFVLSFLMDRRAFSLQVQGPIENLGIKAKIRRVVDKDTNEFDGRWTIDYSISRALRPIWPDHCIAVISRRNGF